MIKIHNVACDLCGSSDADFLFEGKDRLYGCEGIFTYVQCKKCNLVYMNPQISPDDIGKFYPPDYDPHKQKSEKKPQNQSVLKAKLKKRPFAVLICDKLTQQSRILDIGCGNADFLNKVRNVTKCQVYGIDISESASKAAKTNYEIDIFTGTILESPFPCNYFDVITAWWYLEHVPNPSEVLRKMSSLLKQDGYCIIGVPNIDSFNARIFKDKWYHLDCPRHLYIYSPDTITKLLDKTGFFVTNTIFDKTPWGLFPSLRYRFGNDDIPLKNRKRFRGSSLLKRFLSPWTILLAMLKKSDIIAVCSRKKNCVLENDEARPLPELPNGTK